MDTELSQAQQQLQSSEARVAHLQKILQQRDSELEMLRSKVDSPKVLIMSISYSCMYTAILVTVIQSSIYTQTQRTEPPHHQKSELSTSSASQPQQQVKLSIDQTQFPIFPLKCLVGGPS